MCNEKKDVSLLRPFDLEAAKRGKVICFEDGTTPSAWFINNGMLFVEWTDEPQRFVQFASHEFKNWRMEPLCWVRTSVEDGTLKPVYKGDVLYGHWDNNCPAGYVITGENNGIPIGRRNDDIGMRRGSSILSDDGDYYCTPPKVKRKVCLKGWIHTSNKEVVLRETPNFIDSCLWKRSHQLDTTIEIEE